MSNSEFTKILAERQSINNLIDEAKKELERLNTIIKNHMGDKTELFTGGYHVIYKEVTKIVADTAKMKQAGIYDSYSKPQVSRPLYVK